METKTYQVRGKKNAQRTQTMRIYLCELHVNVISSTGALRMMGDKLDVGMSHVKVQRRTHDSRIRSQRVKKRREVSG